MATLLDITNKVLRRLREDPVTTLTESYPLLIAEFVADKVNEINHDYGWIQNDHLTIATVPATGSAEEIPSTNPSSILLFDSNNMPQVWILEQGSSSRNRQLLQMTWEDYFSAILQDSTVTSEEPSHFAITIQAAYPDQYSVALWPTPTASRSVRMRFNTPPEPLDVATDAAEEIRVAPQAVYLGALYMALNERGEEIGEPGGIAERRYLNALAQAKEVDIRNRERTGAYDFYRV